MTTPGFWLPYRWGDCPNYWQNFVQQCGSLVEDSLTIYGAKFVDANSVQYDVYVEFESDEAFTRFLLEFA